MELVQIHVYYNTRTNAQTCTCMNVNIYNI